MESCWGSFRPQEETSPLIRPGHKRPRRASHFLQLSPLPQLFRQEREYCFRSVCPTTSSDSLVGAGQGNRDHFHDERKCITIHTHRQQKKKKCWTSARAYKAPGNIRATILQILSESKATPAPQRFSGRTSVPFSINYG